ncbi:MAG: triose-phosphate isomerase [bacterium]|nr:triose-phosphate isomerase [bacterium]
MQPLLIANWKMQLTDAQSARIADAVRQCRASGVSVVLCPSFTALPEVARVIDGADIALGAQDCAFAEHAALTGEVSPDDLVREGCTYVLIGHSERRHVLGESDEVAGKKLCAAARAGLRPVLCVGETAAEREAGLRNAVLERQCTAALASAALDEVIIAYEPVWAIGTGVHAAPDDASEAADTITALVAKFGIRARILYGGSVDATNVADFLRADGITGVLVGTASQSADDLCALIGVAVAMTEPL